MNKVKNILRKLLKLRRMSIRNICSRIGERFGQLLFLLKIIKPVHKDFHKNIDELASQIPGSNGSHYYQKADIDIGIITDEYMYNYYSDAVRLHYLPADGYIQIIDSVKPAIVMFISCWKGMGDRCDWRGEARRQKVCEVFTYAKSKGITTVFQSIEDPSNYHVFLDIARAADYIFTSSAEVVDDYIKDTNNGNVFVLDYGVNPLLHNPIGLFNKQRIQVELLRDNAAFFAGSWAPRYKERCSDMRMIFDGIIQTPGCNLIIADRNMYANGYNFPYKYARYLIPPIEHKLLQKVHKLFTWTVNINSIKNSSVMCAMRVYEIQALGGLLISNYALSVTNRFPNVFTVVDSAEVAHIIRGYTPQHLTDMQVSAIRNVMSGHTVFDKLNYIFYSIQYGYCFKSRQVLVICRNRTETVMASFCRQTYAARELFEFSELDKIDPQRFDYFILLEQDKVYSRYYLEDLVNAFKYTNVDYVHYADNLTDLPYNFATGTQQLSGTLYDMKLFDSGSLNSLTDLDLKGFTVLQPPNCIPVPKLSRRLGVIIPVYNNGKFLKHRCMTSLARSSVFGQMQLYIIDDGSTDEETIIIISEIEQQYANVTTFLFKDGGSGTASRPRNKGVELCQEEYITFLDPDNEAINDGYAKLLEIADLKQVDLAFGTILRITDSIMNLHFMYKEAMILFPRQELISRKFKSQSIQACVIKRDLISRHQISSPVGGAGQDTLFFFELMLNARCAYHILLPIHIYYAQRGESVINTVNTQFFEKFYLMERYQVKKLEQYGVLDLYIEHKFSHFMQAWYLEKLKRIDEKEYQAASHIIEQITALYQR